MKGVLAAGLSMLVVTVVVVVAVREFVAWAANVSHPQLEWAYLPAGVPADAPFAAWYALSVPDTASRSWVQLRICGADARCVLGARKNVGTDAPVGLVTASRSLAPGTYTLDLLVVSEDRLGVARTVQRASSQVQYGE